MQDTFKRLALILLGCVILAGVSYLSISANSAEIWSPLSLLLVMPLFAGWSIEYVILFQIATFLGFATRLLARKDFINVPLELRVLIWAVIPLTVIWFVISGRFGVIYQGWSYLLGTLMINAVLALTLIILCSVYKRIHKWSLLLLIVVLSNIWLFSYAFPYLGELP